MDSWIGTWIQQHMPVIGGVDDLPLVPAILEQDGGEFCACDRLDPVMVAATCRNGYIPMGLELPGLPLLLVKSHARRCILDPSEVHVGRNVRRYARGLRIRCNGSFSEVMSAVVDAHTDRWLIPPLVKALEKMYAAPVGGVRVHSVEVQDEKKTLVAGEIGYSFGDVYTSLSGFHRRNGTGTVQMVALAVLLQESGVRFWDLGMEADYKMHLGATLVERNRFLAMYRRRSEEPRGMTGIVLPDEWRECPALVRTATIQEKKRENGRKGRKEHVD